ncbi:MAG: NosD domain-containing protein [Promethearchaeota archaeon]
MKNKKMYLVLLIGLSIFFCSFITQFKSIGIELEEHQKRYRSLKSSFVLTPFIIDDSGAGDYTWAEAVLQPWCTGSGTQGDPYIIENVFINGGGSGSFSCIEIRESFSAYFIIRNCTCSNALSLEGYDGGIKLKYVWYGQIVNNDCSSNNNANGIVIEYSRYITISDNTVNDNSYSGIFVTGDSVVQSRSLTITNNIINNNDHDGILFNIGFNSMVSGNNLTGNMNGITIWGESTNIELSNNHISGSDSYGYGIFLYDCSNNHVLGNTITDTNQYNGIYLLEAHNNMVEQNSINQKKGDYGIYLESSNDNLIVDNSLKGIWWPYTWGIYLYESERNNVSGNQIDEFGENAIYLTQFSTDNIITRNIILKTCFPILIEYSDRNILTKNDMTHSTGMITVGISFEHSSDNELSENTFDRTGCGVSFSYSHRNIINNHNIKVQIGIVFDHSNNNELNHNTINSDSNCISISNSQFNTIHNNTISNKNGNGVVIQNSLYNVITDNRIESNRNWGILLNPSNSESNTIRGNLLEKCGIGLAISTLEGMSSPNVIDSTNLVNGKPFYYFIHRSGLGNSDFSGAGQIILVNCTKSTISNEDVSEGTQGISLYFCNNNTISSIISKQNRYRGIYLYQCENTKISKNNASANNLYGIHMDRCNYTRLSKNLINQNGNEGVYIDKCIDPTLINNEVIANIKSGIFIFESIESKLINNSLMFNDIGMSIKKSNATIILNNYVNNNPRGIVMEASHDNLINANYINGSVEIGLACINLENCNFSKNEFTFNELGIMMESSNNNIIEKNIIHDNIICGVNMSDNSIQNIIYNNSFNNPTGENAIEHGDNMWDYDNTGNFWHDYDGYDCNGDGIGETPYIHDLLIDNFPLCDRADIFKPDISIIIPAPDGVFGKISPNFTLEIDEYLIESMWYTFDNGITNYTFYQFSDIFNQSLWDSLPGGNYEIVIIFNVRDVAGNIGNAEVIIFKDIIDPEIIINNPTSEAEFIDEPTYFISIIEPNLESMWYTIDGGITNYTISQFNGTINQIAWDNAPEGDVLITFYARDKAGNIGSESIIVIKRPPSTGVPGYNLFLLLGILVISIILIQRKFRNN